MIEKTCSICGLPFEIAKSEEDLERDVCMVCIISNVKINFVNKEAEK